MDLRRVCVAFPVVDGRLGHANLYGNISLKKSQIEPFLSDMIA
ncbi:MAG: hypothetical protein HW419_3117 [Deltaproteobacteria bacterium]|nr:hypothetical protein [Deltaproteobacteria bacterium]